jgi:hypothetical protein
MHIFIRGRRVAENSCLHSCDRALFLPPLHRTITPLLSPDSLQSLRKESDSDQYDTSVTGSVFIYFFSDPSQKIRFQKKLKTTKKSRYLPINQKPKKTQKESNETPSSRQTARLGRRPSNVPPVDCLASAAE